MEQGEVGILVVDDVNSMRVQIKMLLKKFGFKRVYMASNGEEAKQAFESERIDLILSDWQMMPTNGLDLLRHVRNHRERSTVPFILITANNTRHDVLNAIQCGVDDYLVKPLTYDQIQSKIYKILLEKKVI